MHLNFKTKHKILLSILLLLFVFLFSLSSLVKYLINKNGEAYSGRKIQLEELHFNFLKLSIKAKQLTVYEQNGRDRFLSLDELFLDFEPWRLLSNEYALSELRLIAPYVSVIQSENGFNFDDLMKSENAEPEIQDSIPVEKNALKFSIKNIKLVNGQVEYLDQVVNNHIDMNNLNLKVPEIAWNNEESKVGVDFTIGNKGQVGLTAKVDHTNESFEIDVTTKDISIDFAGNYLKDYLNLKAIQGLFSSELKLKGDLNHVAEILVKGSTVLNDFKMTDTNSKELLYTKTFEVNVDSIDMKNSHFGIGKVRIHQPIVHVDLFEKTTNWEQFLAPTLETDTTSTTNDTLKEPKVDTISSPTYAVKEVFLEDGSVLFEDHTLNRPFRYDLTAINTTVENITETSTNVPVNCKFKLNGKGEFHSEGRFNMQQPFDMNLKGHIKNLNLLSFSPYSEYHIASPITQGTLHYNYSLNMTPTRLKNENQININELEFGKRTKDKTAVKLPIKLALYVIKDKDDRIEIDLPVRGNPSEPGFRMGPIIWKTLSKFILKAATQPFGALSKLVGTNPEEIEALPFEYLQDSLSNKQIRILDNIAKILKKKPDLVFSFSQHTNYEKERNLLAQHKAWAQFQAQRQPSAPELKFRTDNSEFLVYLLNQSQDSTQLTPVQRSVQIIGPAELDKSMKELIQKRNLMVTNYLQTAKQIPTEALNVETSDLRNLPEELKQTKFKIEVSVK
ncbi:MAG: DUF748 domain-containing protein [Marinifilaceae bacterium]